MTDENTESWVEKYRPDSLNTIQGHNKQLKQLKKWAKTWQEGDQPQLLVGDPGIGKTTTAMVIADEMGYPLTEINASDSRKKDDLEHIKRLARTSPIDADYQLVLIDEVDSQSGRTSKQPLVDALDDPKNPIMLTANDKYDVPGSIKGKCNVHEFSLGKRSRKAYLKKVRDGEDLDLPDADLEELAERPDLRSAIQDLQQWAQGTTPVGEDHREWDMSEFDMVDNILRGKKEVGDNISPPDMVMWLDENVTNEYRGVELAKAYDALSHADLWLRRAQTEDYRYWKYAGECAEQVANLRISDPYDGWMDKDFPNWFRGSTPKPTNKDGTASLFRTLKNWDGGGYEFSGSYAEFRRVHLPILRDLPVDEKLALAHYYGLEKKELEVLDLSKREMAAYKEGDVPEERRETEASLRQSDVMDW